MPLAAASAVMPPPTIRYFVSIWADPSEKGYFVLLCNFPTVGLIPRARSSGRSSCRPFREAIAFVNRVAELAEEANHHPDIAISYKR